jgi:hypothetical protein
MARGRLLVKSLSTSQRYANLYQVAGPLAELCQSLYPLLIVHADDWGRLAGDVFTVKHAILPASPRSTGDVEKALAALDIVGLICWYHADGQKWIQIQKFDAHQSGLHKRTPSLIPEPPDSAVPGNSRKFPEVPGNSGSRARAELNRTELKRREEKSTRRSRVLAAPDVPTYRKNAAAPHSKPKPKIQTLAAVIRADILPLGFTNEGDILEAAKRRAAQLHLTYNSGAIRAALASALGQTAAKRGQA